MAFCCFLPHVTHVRPLYSCQVYYMISPTLAYAAHAFPDTPSCYVPRPHESTDYLVDTPEPRALLQRTFLGHHPLEMMHSPYVSPASHRVLRAFYGELFAASVQDLTVEALSADFLGTDAAGHTTWRFGAGTASGTLSPPTISLPSGACIGSYSRHRS